MTVKEGECFASGAPRRARVLCVLEGSGMAYRVVTICYR